MIISCGFSIIKNIFKTKVEASEAVEVTPTWNDGTYTYQADNQFLTLRQNQIDQQDALITFFYNMLTNGNDTQIANAKTTLNNIKQFLVTSIPGQSNWGGYETKFIWFGRVTNSINGSNSYGYCYQILPFQLMGQNNIVYHDATLNSGYKILSVPFYEFERAAPRPIRYVNTNDGTCYTVNTGTASCPVAEVGCYSTRWVEVFQAYGLLDNPSDYESLFAELQETTDLNYTANFYTKEAVENTYSYIINDNVDNISSSGITQPEVTEPDISDAFDSLTELLTNDNATTKAFTLTLPNGYQQAFSLSPDFLRSSLTRVGGGALVTIIETLWYIGLYGLMIFTYLKIIGALMAGDLDSVTGVLSPVNSVVNSSLEVTGAFRTSGGDESAFRIRKG